MKTKFLLFVTVTQLAASLTAQKLSVLTAPSPSKLPNPTSISFQFSTEIIPATKHTVACNSKNSIRSDITPSHSSTSESIILISPFTTIIDAIVTNFPDHKLNITWQQFSDAITMNNYTAPENKQYVAFMSGIIKYGSIATRREAAMFLAQILHESGGLRYKAEVRCVQNPKACIKDYQDRVRDKPGKLYYGRGYIQLTWAVNYQAASMDIYKDDRLLKDPDSVSSNEDISWAVSFWYWKANVHIDSRVLRGEFGRSTALINGAIECSSTSNVAAQHRFFLYTNVMKAFGIKDKPNPNGCTFPKIATRGKIGIFG